MLSVLTDILCAILNLPFWIIDKLVMALNGLIALIGLTISGLLLLLPDMPEAPAMPEGDFLDAVQYIFPLGAMLGFMLVALTVFFAFMAFKIIFNWLRVL